MAIARDELLSQRGRLPAVKSRTSVQNVGGTTSVSEKNTLAFDVNSTSLEDIRWMLRSIALEEIGQQYDVGNVASRVIVDGKFTKDLLKAQRKIEVLFGVEVERQAMELVERVLQQAIDMTTKPREGFLRDVRGHWEWVYAAKYDAPAVPVTAENLKALVPGSYIILRPKIEHAGIANAVAKTPGGKNYLELTQKALRGKRPLANFRVVVGLSRKFQIEGEKSYLGTPFIRLTIKGKT